MLALAFALSFSLSATESLKLAEPGLSVIGLSQQRAEFFTEHLAGRLLDAGVQVTTAKAIEQLLGVERQKQLLGCNEQHASCLVEIANALGSDGIVFGEIAKVGASYQVNLKVVSALDGKIISNYQARAAEEEGVLDELDRGAGVLAQEASTALQKPLAPTKGQRASAGGGGGGRLAKLIIPAALGVVAAAVGGVLLGLAAGDRSAIPAPGSGTHVSLTEAQAHANQGSTFQTVGWVLVGVGAVGLAAGIVLFLVSGPSGGSAGLTPTPTGFAFAF